MCMFIYYREHTACARDQVFPDRPGRSIDRPGLSRKTWPRAQKDLSTRNLLYKQVDQQKIDLMQTKE